MLFLYSEERNTFINAEQIESICVSSDANIDDAVSIKVYIKGEDAGAGYIMGRGKKRLRNLEAESRTSCNGVSRNVGRNCPHLGMCECYQENEEETDYDK